MELSNGLLDAVLVLRTEQPIVFNVVDGFQEENAPECINHLVLEGLPAKEVVDGEADR